MNAKSFFSSYGMNLASIESDHESNYFIKACENNSDSFDSELAHLGGSLEIIDGNEKWFLTSTGKEISYNLNELDESDDNCLAIVKKDKKFVYTRVKCYDDNKAIHNFICQKMIIKLDDWTDIFGR